MRTGAAWDAGLGGGSGGGGGAARWRLRAEPERGEEPPHGVGLGHHRALERGDDECLVGIQLARADLRAEVEAAAPISR
jgi:hypothetical protein